MQLGLFDHASVAQGHGADVVDAAVVATTKTAPADQIDAIALRQVRQRCDERRIPCAQGLHGGVRGQGLRAAADRLQAKKLRQHCQIRTVVGGDRDLALQLRGKRIEVRQRALPILDAGDPRASWHQSSRRRISPSWAARKLVNRARVRTVDDAVVVAERERQDQARHEFLAVPHRLHRRACDTPRIATSGALMIGVNEVPPMPPSEEIEKQPP
jgi:hypothetical protein